MGKILIKNQNFKKYYQKSYMKNLITTYLKVKVTSKDRLRYEHKSTHPDIFI